ncbi:hypothetical protein [Desulfofustis limnaeus]|uniref:PilZ domain-containing protein n=1 Tax=Desulfofustis limnaeus TaxID=2740163 RepID=A0ABM7W8I2_9BACT|nr:hypothetical protein [Desulfofustis limnaeus]MDX9894367.1 hypothetical protein [Desulfofustis sp.]BDD87250.1 hypothetical protein DPPLL_16150 [Desulfofustis limnaeus]
MKTREFKVVNSRMHFRCPHCGTKRVLPVAPSLRRKSFRCHRCQTVVNCMLNRRSTSREPISGKVLLVMSNGLEAEVFLHDISAFGVGFLLPYGSKQTIRISTGDKVRFKSNWNARSLGNGYYEIKDIKGQRVGAMKCR